MASFKQVLQQKWVCWHTANTLCLCVCVRYNHTNNSSLLLVSFCHWFLGSCNPFCHCWRWSRHKNLMSPFWTQSWYELFNDNYIKCIIYLEVYITNLLHFELISIQTENLTACLSVFLRLRWNQIWQKWKESELLSTPTENWQAHVWFLRLWCPELCQRWQDFELLSDTTECLDDGKAVATLWTVIWPLSTLWYRHKAYLY